jgi:hypothetical protein
MGCALFLLVVVGFLALSCFSAMESEKRKKIAKVAYDESLSQLRENPTNPEFREQALSNGRSYSNLTRNQSEVAVYDEIAIKNDIDAACAGAVNMRKQPVEARLGKLQELLSKGLLDEAEYATRRQKILDEL